MVVLKHKLFKGDPGPSFFRGLGSDPRPYSARGQAEEFANRIGAENIVSIIEHVEPYFTVVVWYREEQVARTRAKTKPAATDEFFDLPPYE